MASAEVEERWQAKRSTVAERNKFLLNNSLMSDVRFSFPGSERNIPAHKHVLAISSPVFFAMFYGDLADSRDTVAITDCDPDIFLHFLRFIYSDEANFEDMDCAISVWCLADKYDVPALAKECANFIDGNIDPVKALEILPYARQSHEEHLEKVCWAVIDYRTKEVVASESFLEITHDLLLAFLERTSLLISREIELFKAVNSWAERRCEEAGKTASGENKRAMMGEDLLTQIRFSLMSPGEFSYTVLPTEILLSGEVIDVFRKLNSVHRGDFKFSVSPRRGKIGNFLAPSNCTTGSIHAIGKEGPRNIPQVISKSGLLTFTLNHDQGVIVVLYGVRIVVVQKAQHRENVPITLTISERGVKILRQIKGQQFTLERQGTFRSKKYPSESRYYGHVNVVFNRPLNLTSKVCYTIETETDSTDDMECFVWPNESPQQVTTTITRGVTRGNVSEAVQGKLTFKYIFGYCGDRCPAGRRFGGEILELFLIPPSG